VLSGFLITYLLTHEAITTGTINSRNYFLRRALRIWPLYFIGVALAYSNNFITGRLSMGAHEGYDPNPLFSLTFLENYQMIRLNNFPNGAPLRVFWSLCVEEHFYILWLLLFLFVPVRHFIKTAIVLWITGILYRMWFLQQFPDKIYAGIDVISKLDYFCAGGIAGYSIATAFDTMHRRIHSIPRTIRYLLTILVIVFFFGHQFISKPITDSVYFAVVPAILFALLLLLIATTATFIHIRETTIFSRLGKLSYGLYVYHTVVILAVMMLLKLAHIEVKGGNLVLFAAGCFILTVLISRLSYRYIESYFLQLKQTISRQSIKQTAS
jgi:peptidoglycan/LPS O-acetylase OafA/YrhL